MKTIQTLKKVTIVSQVGTVVQPMRYAIVSINNVLALFNTIHDAEHCLNSFKKNSPEPCYVS